MFAWTVKHFGGGFRFFRFTVCDQKCCQIQGNGRKFHHLEISNSRQQLNFPGLGIRQFAHRFSERIARFLLKNVQMSDSLKKTSHSLIFGERPEQFAHGCSFLVSDLSKSLIVAHFWWATWAICLHRSFWWAIWAIRSHCSPKRGNEQIAHFLNKKKLYKTYYKIRF